MTRKPPPMGASAVARAAIPSGQPPGPAFEARVQRDLAACLGRIPGSATLDETAQSICDQLCAIPWVESAEVDAFVDGAAAVVLAVRDRHGSPLHSGDHLGADRAEHLRACVVGGEPWTETRVSPDVGAPPTQLACLPIVNGDAGPAVLVVGTTQPRHALTLVGQAPGVVAFTTAISTLLVGGLQTRQAQAEIRHGIEQTLAEHAFRPVFQPIVAIGSGELLGFEALTRFSSGRRPDLCFAEAWDVGLGCDLELATLRAALDKARHLPPNCWLDVNVSPRVLVHPLELKALLETADRPLVLEITEHEQVPDYAALRDSVRSLGPRVRLAVDDAGAGAANFAHIIELKPDYVKLDIGLVRGIDQDLGRQALVVAMLHYAKETGCQVVAEGVETQAEADTLNRLLVPLAQGFLFGRPATAEHAWLSEAAERRSRSASTVVPEATEVDTRAEVPTEATGLVARLRRWPEFGLWADIGHGEHDAIFARYAFICAALTMILMAVGALAGPPGQRPGLLAIDALAGPVVAVTVWFMRRGISRTVLVVAGLILMALGPVAGSTLADGLDGAAIMPLAGAMMLIPVVRGRGLFAAFAFAFGLSIAGETAAYTLGGLTRLGDTVSAPQSIAESGVMLAFTYGLVWWVSKEWRIASQRRAEAAASERQVLTINERLLATLDPQKVLNLIADSLKSVVDYDNLTIYRVDAVARLMIPVLARDRFAALILESSFSMDRGITGWVATHGTPQCVNDAHLDPRMRLIPGTPAEPESLIVVPLIVDGRVLGTLNVGRVGRAEAHFDEREFEVVRLFARQASIALRNADVHQAVWARAQTDEVTALRNRGAFEQAVAGLVEDEQSRPLTLLMLDLDHYKIFNDRYGHPAGDALLRGVGLAIAAAVRERELVFRYGGDEFVVLLPGTTEEDGLQVAGRIRAAVAASASVTGVPVTASVGVACQSVPGGSRDALVAAADAALYRAKMAGGDRAEVSGPYGIGDRSREGASGGATGDTVEAVA